MLSPREYDRIARAFALRRAESVREPWPAWSIAVGLALAAGLLVMMAGSG